MPEEYLSPRHIGIILDGNRRYAKKLMLKPWEGHEIGAKKAQSILQWSLEQGIRELTLYVLSVQNLERSAEEISYLMDVFRGYFDRLKDSPLIHDNQVRVNFIGRLWMLPADIQESAQHIMHRTQGYDRHIVNYALAYGGREEISDAVRRIAQKVQDGKLTPGQITESLIGDNLYINSDPDLIIRTGGDYRTSNFLPWQSTYSEWFFLDKTWPEFERQDLLDIIDQFRRRDRRFGR